MGVDGGVNPLSQTEYDLVSEAIYRLVKQYRLPGGMESVGIDYLTSEAKESICVIPAQDNARYRKKYISGSFEAIINFQIAYKCFPQSDNQKIRSQRIVADMMKWLENVKQLPLLTNDRKITDISLLDSFAVDLNGVGQDGGIAFVSCAALTYFKKNNIL